MNKKLVYSLLGMIIVCLITGLGIGIYEIYKELNINKATVFNEIETAKNDNKPVQESINLPEEPVVLADTYQNEPKLLGEWRVTAYCSCEICCGKWAKNRPNGVVYGAYGEILIPNQSVAASLPFETKVKVEGLGDYIVHDKVSQKIIQKYGDTIDIYMDSHKDAQNFGLKYFDVYLLEDEIIYAKIKNQNDA